MKIIIERSPRNFLLLFLSVWIVLALLLGLSSCSTERKLNKSIAKYTNARVKLMKITNKGYIVGKRAADSLHLMWYPMNTKTLISTRYLPGVPEYVPVHDTNYVDCDSAYRAGVASGKGAAHTAVPYTYLNKKQTDTIQNLTEREVENTVQINLLEDKLLDKQTELNTALQYGAHQLFLHEQAEKKLGLRNRQLAIENGALLLALICYVGYRWNKMRIKNLV